MSGSAPEQRRKANMRAALLLGGLALSFFLAAIVKYKVFGQ